MKKKSHSVFVICTLILMLVVVVVISLHAYPYMCTYEDIRTCEAEEGGTWYAYFEFWAWYYGEWFDVYDTYCDGEPWGLCYDFDDIYPDPPYPK